MDKGITAQLADLASKWEQARDQLAVDHEYLDAEDEIYDEMSHVYGECAAAVQLALAQDQPASSATAAAS